MADPFGTGAGIVGVLGLSLQITQVVIEFGLNWQDAPDNIKVFMTELRTMETALFETQNNVVQNPDFAAAFQNQRSSLLSYLGPHALNTNIKVMLDICREKLESLLEKLKKKEQSHPIGWERFKSALLAKDTRDSVENLSRQCQYLNSMLSIDTAVLAANTHKEVSEARKEQQQWHQADTKTFSAIQSSVDQSRLWQQSKENQAILDWITPINYAPQQHDFISRRESGTGQWLLDAVKYQEWLVTEKTTLFCPGIPGAGKTILTAIVIDDLKTRYANNQTIAVAYIFCNFRRQHEQKIEDLLANLLKQLTQRMGFMPDQVKSFYDHHFNKESRPSKHEILGILRHVAFTFSKVFIVVDALDECQVSDGCRTELLSELFDLQAKCQINLFATSRFIPEVDEVLKNSMQLEIRASEQDVQKYLDGHLLLLPKFVRDNPELKNEVKCEISKAVDGMFLLAQLYLNSLKGKRSPKAVRIALKNLLTGSEAYDYAYKEAMERIESQISDEKDLAKQVLYWIICAKRPLTTAELQHALAVEPGETQLDPEHISQVEDMVSVCAGLVTVDEKSKIIRLVHYTTQEYFKRTQHKWFPAAEESITSTCITYLSFHSFNSGVCRSDAEFKERLRLYTLYYYAAQNWGHHARVASVSTTGVTNFLYCKPNLEASIQALMAQKRHFKHLKYSENFPRRMTGLHIAAYFGIKSAINILLDQEQLDIQDSYGKTPLSWAAENGHEAVVKLLLDTNKVDVNLQDNEYGQTPLLLAAENGHEAVVRLLLDTNKVDVNLQDNEYGQTPLLLAAENGHEAVVRLLLDTNKVDVNLQDNEYGQTPLLLAVKIRNEAVVKLLLDTGKVDVNLQDNEYGQTPLLLAAGNGNEAVVRLLLDTNKVDVNLQDNEYGQTPLLLAVKIRNEAVVKLLLDTGKVDVNLQDNEYGQTPLLLAAGNGNEAVVRLLLDTGKVDVDSRSKYGRTPLLLAVKNRHEAVVRLLLDTGKVDVNLQDNEYGQTPLLWAAENGHEAVVKLLLDTGKVDVNLQDNEYGRTPLSWAAGNGYEAVVRLLLDTGKVDVNLQDNEYGQTPLSWAAGNGREAVVRLLLDTGKVDVDSRNKYGRTPLSWAAGNGHEAVVRLLLHTGKVDVDSQDDKYDQTPLSWAAENGHEAIVRLLIDTGKVDVDSQNNKYGQTPLLLAAENGHNAVVRLLLDTSKVDVNSRSVYGKSPLLLTAGEWA